MSNLSSEEYNICTEQGFEQMYRAYYKKIYNFVFYRLLSKETAEDIVSEIFLKIAKNSGSFSPEKASLNTWVWHIAKNTLTDYFRRAQKTISIEQNDLDEFALKVDFEEQYESIASEQRKMLYAELQKLPERNRLIVYYKFFEEKNNREIAKILNINESTVGTILSRVLKALGKTSLADLR